MERDAELKLLQERLEELKRQQTQEDFDKGNRLHAEKNAPWVNGMYSHLTFPPYVYQEYPKAMYSVDYDAAKAEWDAAHAMIVSGTDLRQELAIREATRKLDRCVCQVANASEEMQRFAQGWRTTQADAKKLKLALENEIATQAGHLAYEDRNLTGKALEERELADEVSEGHLTDVTATLKQHREKRGARA